MITSHPFFHSIRVRTALCLAALFALNVYICHNLFNTEFTQETNSVDLAFISFSRWLVDHWNDRSWFPVWLMGTPARQVYNPLLHHTVAFLARTTGWTAQHAYHFVTATTYSLGPLTLFWLCYRLTRRHGYALLTALVYSLISPSAFLSTAFRIDNGRLFNPRRFQTLVHYGEGPHVTALMLIPLTLWLLDQAAVKRRWMFLPLATIGVAAIPLTNWTGTTGFVMALSAYIIAKVSSKRLGENPIHWPTLIGIGVLAYALAATWLPPSLIRSVQESAAKLDSISPNNAKVASFAIGAVMILGLHFLFQRYRTASTYRFFFFFTVISGVVTMAKMWFNVVLIPISSRFHLEMEMAIAGCAAFFALAIVARLPRTLQIVLLVVAVLAGAEQTRIYRREARKTTTETDVSQTPENRMATALVANANGARVFAPGSVALWLNMRSDIPQFYGCCDQTVRTEEVRMAGYEIYTGDGAGDREGEIAAGWLQAFGVRYIGVSSLTAEAYPPYRNSKKFDGVLEEVWRDGDNVVYRVPSPDGSLAHVIPAAVLNQRPPVNGIDTEALAPLLAALDHPPAPATFRWINQHEAEISARTDEGQVLFVQETCDPGWHGFEGATERKVSCGPLGLITIDPQDAGSHTIRLTYSASTEDNILRSAQLAAILILVVWTLRARRRSLLHPER